MCALKNWQEIVRQVDQASVVFNLIDVGEYFDIAVQALCMKKKKLLLQGGTFCQQLNVDMFRPGEGCVVCSGSPQNAEVLEKLMPSKIESIENMEFIPRDRNPVGQTNVYVCTICSQMLVGRFATLLINDPEVHVE